MTTDPKSIGRYQIESVLGRGAMGVIYRAHDPEIDRPVALKLIRADLLDSEDRADYLVRFRREAQAAGRCTHPNIVTIYDFATHEGNPFLAMEFIDGMNLSQARDKGTVFSPTDAVFVILQVLDALGAMHALAVVHRDIKPANVLLVDGRRVKVTDFGISRFDTSDLTQDGSVVGTPSYMSPEQCRGDPVDARSDLFSTGVMLYELLARARPFAGRNFAEVTQRLLYEPPPDIRTLSPTVSDPMKAAIERALAKAPGDRFASAAAMSAALQAALQEPGTQFSDHTIIIPQTARPPAGSGAPATVAGSLAGMTGRFDRAALDTLERRLAHYVGPIARRLVQSAISKAESVEALCTSLAANIAQGSDRDEFRASVLEQLRTSSSMATSTAVPGAAAVGFSDDELQRVQKELARYVGPVARLLVKRGAVGVTSIDDLWQRLALHIDRDPDRALFLARQRGR